ncbi:MAG: large conductance mechanosensitive channel protein MscL [Clostridia bacterium]|nr:large conductance mechanosensitive channel protein MscL [Clostridia bacterium]
MGKEKKGFWGEFREFATKGSVIDLAVGVIIGGAFSAITSSLVNDVVMPFVGLFLGGVDFTSWSVTVGPIFANAEPSVITIGNFIQAVVNFIVLALVIFFFVRSMNRARARAEEKAKAEAEAVPPAPPAPTETELLGRILEVLETKENE